MARPSLPPQAPDPIFDRTLLKNRRNRVATSYSSYGFLKARAVVDLAGRLTRIRRTFHQGIDLGSHTGQLGKAVKDIVRNPLIAGDISEGMVAHAPAPFKVVLDEEALPFAENSLDLVMSALSLHWVNDLPGFLAQTYACLKPDGLFLASLLGENTLIELRDCFARAELEHKGGISPRLSPMVSLQDAGALLQRAGFSLPVTDHDRLQVTYSHPLALLHDLRYMGETNALHSRSRSFLPRAVLTRMVDLYQERYSLPDGRIQATFDIVTLTGWKPC